MALLDSAGGEVMRSLDALPNAPLAKPGPVTARFRALGIDDVHGAARYLLRLPYGRISNREDATRVLAERRGTCTTKHALLAMLAAEQGVDVALTVGIYEMRERNTPGVGRVLARHGLEAVPEAHCYLRCRGERIDITREAEAAEPNETFLHEETITPAQIGQYKIDLHRSFLATWLAASDRGGGRSLEDVWRIREECIQALSEGSAR